MRMNGEKDGFLFLGVEREERVCLYLFIGEDVRERWVSGVDKLKSWQHGGLMTD